MNLEIEKLDDLGRGIGFTNGKVTFVPWTIPKDIVNVNIIKSTKKYNVAEVQNYIKLSKDRIKPKCPYFTKCGGCSLQNMIYENTTEYKLNKVKNIFKKNKVDINPIMVSNPQPYNYRNKISLKVVDKKIGFYETKTHRIIPVSACALANSTINKCISYLNDLNITNGDITIKCNQDEEVIISINTSDKMKISIDKIKEKIKLIGVILNGKVIYGQDYFLININNFSFKVAWDSFFQVNPYVASKMFAIITDNIANNDMVLDLYCGVGALSLGAARIAKKVVGIEIVPSAIKSACFNAEINKLNNVQFILGDATKLIKKLDFNFNKVIVDPPRSGLTNELIEVILEKKPDEIIYVSCDPQTLVRDYLLLSREYEIVKSYVLDMFSYTYHVESILCLQKKR